MINIDELSIGELKQLAKLAAAIGGCGDAKSTAAIGAERAVLVTTEHRGVFFGYATDTAGDTITLKRARNCVYWSTDCKGFLGLAENGPTASCRIGPPADIELRKITCVAEVTPEAVAAWEKSPWKQ